MSDEHFEDIRDTGRALASSLMEDCVNAAKNKNELAENFLVLQMCAVSILATAAYNCEQQRLKRDGNAFLDNLLVKLKEELSMIKYEASQGNIHMGTTPDCDFDT